VDASGIPVGTVAAPANRDILSAALKEEVAAERNGATGTRPERGTMKRNPTARS
jgi:hypothetical protein